MSSELLLGHTSLLLLLLHFSVSALKYGGVDIKPGIAKSITLGHRIKAGSLTKEALIDFDGKLPCVLQTPFNELDNESWTNDMVEKLGNVMIEYDARDRNDDGGVTLETYECKLHEYLSALGEGSTHEDSMYFISEDILQLEEARNLMSRIQLPEELFGKDLFRKFPESIRPACALIIGGVGSRSFLHADPYEWTGWNYCFEGKKLWTFFPPETNGDENFLKLVRNPTNAWGEYAVAAGWHSDIDLYHRILETKEETNSPLNKHWKRAYATASPSAVNPPFFASSDPVLEQTDDLWPIDTQNIDLSAIDNDVPSMVQGAIQIVQSEGEMILIPPGWLHQVYSLTPTIAVAGQYCNNQEVRERVLKHIMTWCNETGKKEEAAREEEMAQRERRRLKREDDALLDEFYGEESEATECGNGEGKTLPAAIEEDVVIPPSLAEEEDDVLVPRLLYLALLARYRRQDVAQEVFEELYLDLE